MKMTREQAEALGKRAMRAGWEWRDGAAFWASAYQRRDRILDAASWVSAGFGADEVWPDVRDAATEGILAGQVRERWRNDWLSPVWMGRQWTLPDGFGGSLGKGPTRVHCWIAALEAAPDE